MSHPDDFQVLHEPDRITAKMVWWAAAAGVAFILVSAFVARASIRALATGEPPYGPPAPRAQPEIGIVEQTLVRDSRRGLDRAAEQRRSLEQWGWVDRAHGVARIPIERAMDLVAVDGGS